MIENPDNWEAALVALNIGMASSINQPLLNYPVEG